MLQPVSTPADVIANIHRYVSELEKSEPMQRRLSHHPAWYALRHEDGWIFGPSKFVGCRQNSVEQYLRFYRNPNDGRMTEHALRSLFPRAVDPDSRLGRELFEALRTYLARWGRSPNRRARITVVSETPVAVSASSLDREALFSRVVSNPAVCGGRPCIRGTRIRVTDIIEMLASGANTQEILDDYPDLAREDIQAALAYAARIADHRVIRAA
ncbi:MAG: hypothetical protein BroJett030_21420 [Alphaproteobacteria bacterium]|nr:MAG: hypothetical protein BroJett030_21420 [Alphaproteobacteria bacterium]